MKSELSDLPHNNGESPSAQESRDTQPKPSKLRSVYSQAKQHCANWCRGGTCVGVGFDIYTGRHFFITKEGSPCLLGLDQRCPYFEKRVLPMETRREKDWPTVVQGAAFREAARIYHLTFPETVAVQPTTRKCPDCGKHRISPRKRCCTECRMRRRKTTDAVNHRNWRKEGAPRHTVNQNGSSLGADSRASDLKSAIIYHVTPFFGVNCMTKAPAQKGGAA